MSEITHKNMNVHANQVSKLKSDFIKIYRKDDQAVDKIICQMRIIHAHAIYDATLLKQSIIAKGVDNITDDEWIKLSTNASILDLIHHHIRKCEKLVYEFKQRKSKCSTANVGTDVLTSDTNMLTNTPATNKRAIGAMRVSPNINNTRRPNMNTIIRRNEDGIDEVSIQNTKTESVSAPSNINASDLFSPADNTSRTDQTTPVNTTEYLDRLTTDEAEKMYQELGRNQVPGQTGGHHDEVKREGDVKFDINKPTIVNYWADWCPASKRFLPTWQQFKSSSRSKYPELQVSDLNVGRNPQLNEIAKKAGVKGYPTVVLFYNGKKYHKVGNSTIEQLDQFLNNLTGTNAMNTNRMNTNAMNTTAMHEKY